MIFEVRTDLNITIWLISFFFFPIDYDLQQLNQDHALAQLLSPVIHFSRLMQRTVALLLEMEW